MLHSDLRPSLELKLTLTLILTLILTLTLIGFKAAARGASGGKAMEEVAVLHGHTTRLEEDFKEQEHELNRLKEEFDLGNNPNPNLYPNPNPNPYPYLNPN